MVKAEDANVGMCVINRGEPSKIIKKEKVTVGTHMHSKTKLTIQGLESLRKEVLTLAHSDSLEEVEVINKKGQVISKIPPDQIQLMDLVTYETLSATATKAQFEQISEGSTVSFIDVLGRILILEIRDARQ